MQKKLQKSTKNLNKQTLNYYWQLNKLNYHRAVKSKYVIFFRVNDNNYKIPLITSKIN